MYFGAIIKTMQETNRIFTDVETNLVCRLYTSCDASKYHLIFEGQPDIIADGCEVNGFYVAPFAPVHIKVNNSRELYLEAGQFYNLKEGERVTHRKFITAKRYSKI